MIEHDYGLYLTLLKQGDPDALAYQERRAARPNLISDALVERNRIERQRMINARHGRPDAPIETVAPLTEPTPLKAKSPRRSPYVLSAKGRKNITASNRARPHADRTDRVQVDAFLVSLTPVKRARARETLLAVDKPKPPKSKAAKKTKATRREELEVARLEQVRTAEIALPPPRSSPNERSEAYYEQQRRYDAERNQTPERRARQLEARRRYERTRPSRRRKKAAADG